MNSEEFSEIIAKHEEDILKIAGISHDIKSAPIFEVKEENLSRLPS